MGFYAGVDLGKRKSQIKIITADRKVVEEVKVENDPRTFAQIFRKYKGDIDVACEACGNAFWVGACRSNFAADRTKNVLAHTSQ